MNDLPEVFDELIRFETELYNAVDARLKAECGLPLGSLEALRLIDRSPGCRVNDIAAAFAITIGGTSKLVDRLERAGHVRRSSNPGDRRSSLLELTRAGEQQLAAADPVFRDELARRLGQAVPEPELAQFLTTLKTLRGAR